MVVMELKEARVGRKKVGIMIFNLARGVLGAGQASRTALVVGRQHPIRGVRARIKLEACNMICHREDGLLRSCHLLNTYTH